MMLEMKSKQAWTASRQEEGDGKTKSLFPRPWVSREAVKQGWETASGMLKDAEGEGGCWR